MAKGRWQHLDLQKPVQLPSATPAELPVDARAENTPQSGSAPEDAPHPEVQRARALYALRQFEQCADLLTAALAIHSEIPGARKLLGLALGRLDFPSLAADHLRATSQEAPNDPELRASLISAEIRAGLIPERVSGSATGALAEISGAGEWVRGQASLREGWAVAAAEEFQKAGELFARHSPPEVLAERIAAAYIGEVVSHLAAGQLDAAQRGFSRLRERARLPEPTLQFARGLYELADALRILTPEERTEELAPLVETVLSARIRVRFYDATRPVEMYWENLA